MRLAQADSSLTDHAVVYFGNDWSAENRTSSHHIACRLAKRYPLLYVEVPGLRAPKASGRDMRKLWRKLRQAFQAPRRVGEQMWCITMPQIPFRRLAAVRKLNIMLGQYLVKQAVRKLRLPRTISWFVVPHAGPLAGGLAEDLIVYYCIDDYAALPDVDRNEVARMDEDLTRRADQVFVASATLLGAKQKLNPAASTQTPPIRCRRIAAPRTFWVWITFFAAPKARGDCSGWWARTPTCLIIFCRNAGVAHQRKNCPPATRFSTPAPRTPSIWCGRSRAWAPRRG